ncbi:hypothetical protein XENOCAPTIV_018191 [Xenoophorus captivus]|uniref:Uncharacterized protein n=1 Tax=Xenoophorus captivus TaxID=1517983 RepID=A0ABV0RAP9_9TELE
MTSVFDHLTTSKNTSSHRPVSSSLNVNTLFTHRPRRHLKTDQQYLTIVTLQRGCSQIQLRVSPSHPQVVCHSTSGTFKGGERHPSVKSDHLKPLTSAWPA